MDTLASGVVIVQVGRYDSEHRSLVVCLHPVWFSTHSPSSAFISLCLSVALLDSLLAFHSLNAADEGVEYVRVR
jgi:hypothetical protein